MLPGPATGSVAAVDVTRNEETSKTATRHNLRLPKRSTAEYVTREAGILGLKSTVGRVRQSVALETNCMAWSAK